MKSVGPLEGMTIGAAAGGPLGAAIGSALGGINVAAQFINPNLYDDIKDGAYKLYDKGTEGVQNIGQGISQGVDTVKNVCKDIGNTGKAIGKAISSIKLPNLKFGW